MSRRPILSLASRRRLPFAVGLVCVFATAAPAAAGVTVTYIANEGILVEGGGAKILVDALVDGGAAGYPVPPPDVQAKLEKAEPPFDGIDLVLATHFHGDHFGPGAVSRHLEANPGALFVSTPEATDVLRSFLGASSPSLARVRDVYPEVGQRERVEHRGVTVTVLNLHHGPLGVENLGFLIELDGVKLLHVGDTEATAEDLAPYDLPGETIDVALVGAWYLVYDHWIQALREAIRPRRVVALHLPRPDAPAGHFGPSGSYEGRVRQIRNDFPAAVVFERPMSTLTFSSGD